MTDVVETARRYLGYRALPLKNSAFGPSGRDWNGAFVRRMFQESGSHLPTDDTVELLALILSTTAAYVKPQFGDVVFYRFPAEGSVHGQPHVGIVSDVSTWDTVRSFKAIEGQTAPASPKEDQAPTGVFERVRYHTDVLLFARPFFRVPSELGEPTGPKISVSQIVNGQRHKSVEYVQLALGRVVGLRDATRGAYDGRTRSAMAEYQRQLGRTGEAANGLPDPYTLSMLGAETGEYQLG